MNIKIALLAAWSIAGSSPTLAVNSDWEVLWVKDDITIHTKELAGHNFPVFRGQTIFESNIHVIVSQIVDTTKHMEWMYRCIESRVLKNISASEAVFYNRVDAPFPISDRDIVAYAKVRVNRTGHEILIEFKAIKNILQPEIDGVVRIPKLEGFYRLKILGPNKTHVIYQVEADVAGYIPKFLANLATKRLPAYTLLALRNRVYTVGRSQRLPNNFFENLPKY